MDQPLFPDLQKELKDYTDEELSEILEDYKSRVELIKTDDSEFLGDLAEDVILAQMRVGIDAIKALTAEQDARVEAHENYVTAKNDLAAELEVKAEDEEKADDDDAAEAKDDDEAKEDDDAEAKDAEASAEGDTAEPESEAVEETADDRELVTASGEGNESNGEATTVVVQAPRLRRPPAPSPERIAVSEPVGTTLVAAGEMSYLFKEGLTPDTLAELIIASASHHGPMPKVDPRRQVPLRRTRSTA